MKIRFEETNNYKSWRKAAICFMILFFISAIYLVVAGNKPYEELSKNITCSNIKYTPAWVKDGKILGYGYKDWKELPEGVSFYYHPSCLPCQKQIENFRDLWEDYKKKGVVIDCSQNR